MRKLLEPLPHEAPIGRFVSSLVLGGGSIEAAEAVAKTRYPDSPEVALTIRRKTAVDPMGTDGSALMSYGLSERFQVLFEEASLVGRLSGRMRAAPFNVSVPVDRAGSLAGWAAESDPKPARALSLATVLLPPYKMTAIVILSKELATRSTPAAERVISTALVSAVSRAVDAAFLGSAAGVNFENPPGVGFGQQTHVSTGGTAAQIAADISSMAAQLTSWESPVWICRPRTLLHMSALGLVDFSGGTPLLASLPVYTSAASPAQLLLIDLGSVHIADEGAVDLDLSRHSRILADDGGSPPSTEEIGLWDRNLIAVRAEKTISWLTSHTACAVRMNVAY